jgi:N-acetylglutamate synthase-like GNAT family acetyltransferase
VTTREGLRRAGAADIDAVVALQRAAYEKNRGLLGVEPLPLLADYADVLRDYEVWLADGADGLAGVLILEPRADDLLIWSIACAPAAQRQRLGRRLLAAADARALAFGLRTVRLYTGEPLVDNIAWYQRRGYTIERVEQLPGRRLVHMAKAAGAA